MNENTSKRLAEYCEIKIHTRKIVLGEVFGTFGPAHFVSCNICGINPSCQENDFTTPDGWEILAAKIGEKEGWWDFYKYLSTKARYITRIESASCFHEKPAAEKAQIFAEFLAQGV